MEDTPINDMDLDMIEAELNDTNTIDAPAAIANDSTIKQANGTDHTLSTNRFDRPEAIYLFGLDSMSTKDIQNYCQNTTLKKVEWIDDSSCVLVFDSASDAQLAAQALLQDPADSSTMLNSTELRNSKPFERPDFTANNTSEQPDPTQPPVRPIVDNLQIRMATDSDIKTRGARHRSRYYLLHGEPSTDRRANNNDDRPNRTTADGKPLSILDRLGSRVPPLSEQRQGRHRRQHDDDNSNSSSRYDRSSRRYSPIRHSRRRSLSPTRDRPTNAESSGNRPTGAKMDAITPPPSSVIADQDDDEPFEIPDSVLSRLGKID